ncbi:hypothetical protein ANO11243_074150 [Dothideomycetidae sp. 11243]|nr:hypothetical protein ANO11243_074150 [fungal sp. No.11243]
MVHTVGLTGINGNVGVPTLQYLAKGAEQGKFKLVVFHREGTAPKHVSTGPNIEFRLLDFEDPVEKLEEQVKGINTMISAIGFGAIPHEPKLVEALSKSKDLVTYIPSTYSTTWTEEDLKDPHFGPMLGFIEGGALKAKEIGVPLTTVYCGSFENYWFELGFGGSPIKPNEVWASKNQLKHPFPITVLDHLGERIAQIAAKDPQEIKNKNYSVISFMPTGQDFVDLYSKLNGSPAKVKDFTPADRETMINDAANFGPAKVGYWDRWESGNWGYSADGRIDVSQYNGPSLEEIAKRFL